MMKENQNIRYSLKGPRSEFFAIDPITGEIFVSSQGFGNINRERYETFNFRVSYFRLHVVPGRQANMLHLMCKKSAVVIS